MGHKGFLQTKLVSVGSPQENLNWQDLRRLNFLSYLTKLDKQGQGCYVLTRSCQQSDGYLHPSGYDFVGIYRVNGDRPEWRCLFCGRG